MGYFFLFSGRDLFPDLFRFVFWAEGPKPIFSRPSGSQPSPLKHGVKVSLPHAITLAKTTLLQNRPFVSCREEVDVSQVLGSMKELGPEKP